jgi:hypothetical protein
MTKKDCFYRAILSVCRNSAFGNGHGSYVDYGKWAKRIVEAAETLTDTTEEFIGFEEPDQPP